MLREMGLGSGFGVRGSGICKGVQWRHLVYGNCSIVDSLLERATRDLGDHGHCFNSTSGHGGRNQALLNVGVLIVPKDQEIRVS